jgi:SAM-dependent methyltransferase
MENSSFDFGRNWTAFSRHALTPESVAQAKGDFARLLDGIELRDRSFLDIGFGQGLTLLVATSLGATTVGCDINPLCGNVLEQNRARYFSEVFARRIPVVTGSILDEKIVERLRAEAPDRSTRTYDIVHSWGVLHHTGDLQRAMATAASLVGANGHLILAIYRRHWSSGGWRLIKRLYNASPALIQRLMVAILYPVIYLAKWLVTRRNPRDQTRGMNFYYNVVDWVGGYPYEYAAAEDVAASLNAFGFDVVRVNPAFVPTGCNEFICRRRVNS